VDLEERGEERVEKWAASYTGSKILCEGMR